MRYRTTIIGSAFVFIAVAALWVARASAASSPASAGDIHILSKQPLAGQTGTDVTILTVDPMASSSLHRRWDLPSSKDRRSRSSKTLGRRRQRRWIGSGSKPGSNLESRRLPFFSITSGSRGHIITGSREALTNCLSKPTGSASLLVRKTPLPPISSHSRAACEVLQPIIEKVWRTCEGAEIRGRTVTLKVKYADFQQITRSRTGQARFSTRAEIEQLSYALLEPLFPVTKGIRRPNRRVGFRNISRRA
jgi:impB/mucB/samB family C-terminal domain